MNDTAPLTQAPEKATLLHAPPASEHALQIDNVLEVINWVSLISLILITAAMLYFVFKYRRKTEHDETPHISHNLTLEVIWSVIPMVFLFGLFFFGYKTYAEINEPPANVHGAVDIYVTGHQWYWDFNYPEGGKVSSALSLRNEKNKVVKAANLAAFEADAASKDFTPGDSVRLDDKNDYTLSADGKWLKADAAASKKLDDPVHFASIGLYEKSTDPKAQFFVVPVNTPIRVHIKSADVLHSFAIPSMRIKRDAVPGSQFRSTWFTAVKEGQYYYTCNEMCGTDHSYMVGYMKVVSMAEYQKFLKDINVVDPKIAGKNLFTRCVSCHSLDKGVKGVGPSLHGFFENKHPTDKGEVVGDTAYFIESLKNPTAKVATGFPPLMPPQQLTDDEIIYLQEYIKSKSK